MIEINKIAKQISPWEDEPLTTVAAIMAAHDAGRRVGAFILEVGTAEWQHYDDLRCTTKYTEANLNEHFLFKNNRRLYLHKHDRAMCFSTLVVQPGPGNEWFPLLVSGHTRPQVEQKIALLEATNFCVLTGQLIHKIVQTKGVPIYHAA